MTAGNLNPTDDGTRIVRATSAFDCGGRCPLRITVKDNVILRIEGDDIEDSDKQLRTCLRCRAYRQYVHHPDRLKYPMKRVGPKGKGEFERISWDEAYETIIEKLEFTKDTYGNSSIFLASGSGNLASLHGGGAHIHRLMSLFGGYTTEYGNISSEGAVYAVMTHYGSVYVGHSREDFLNSKLIIMWGWDPAKMISGTNTMYHLIKAKEAGVKIIVIDPRYTDSAATLADQWIPIRPGTDPAMMAGMAYVMIKENLHDQAFLGKYTVGFDKYSDYIMGKEDGIEKTPAWAEKISEVPKETIEALAREYATTKPACLNDCQGPARSAMGEQYNRSAMTLTAMTGNVGKPGGSAAGGLMSLPVGHLFRGPGIPGMKNPMEEGKPSVRGTLDLKDRFISRIHTNKIFDAILTGKKGGYPADIKFAWFTAINLINQRGNANKGAEALKHLEFSVVADLFMTPTARYADILLPATSAAEQDDVVRPWPSGPYYAFSNQVIKPLYECKSDFHMVCELAEKMGYKDFMPLSDDELLRIFIEKNPETGAAIPDYDKFKEEGIHRVDLPEPIVAFRKEIEDPLNNPFPTPSGKIEIFSQRVADIGNPANPPIPKYISSQEDHNNPLKEKYPLQLLTSHPKNRVHSSLYMVEWLKEVEPHRAWINPIDADLRGIKDEDEIHVFNDRGKVAIKARVTERIIPGVINIFQGAWYTPDEDGIDQGACGNTLTDDTFSEGGAATFNSSLVEAYKV